MIVLEIESPSSPDRRVEIDAPRTTVGRSPRADLRLDDQFASRIHSELWFDDGACWVSDLGSVNGTYRNGAAILAPVRLRHGDAVQVGQSVLTVAGLSDRDHRSTATAVLDRSAILAAAAAHADPPSAEELELLARDDLVRLQQQLESAREIQARLLPHEPPRMAGYDVRGLSLPCHAVGGDYFDFELWTETRLGIVLGDVSGKGLDAALLISSVHAMMRSQASVTRTLGELVGRVNRYLCDFTPTSKFATVFCGVLDSETHRLHYINAGHNPPLVVRADGTVERLPATSVPLGLVPDERFSSASVELSPGAVVVIYSDGLTEATNPAGEEFGEDRLAAAVHEHRALTTARLRDRIDAALSRFSEGEPPADDLTMVLIKRDP